MHLTVNSEKIRIPERLKDVTLLDFLRDQAGLTGTKYGCGIGLCGACTVHIDGEARRSCLTRVGDIGAGKVTTIEGLAGTTQGAQLHPVQQAWIDEAVPQCGYCQSGQIMSAAALLARIPNPSDTDIRETMRGNICRCGTYGRIRKAIGRAAEALSNA